MKKHKASALIAVGILVLAGVVGVWALMSGDERKVPAAQQDHPAADAAPASPNQAGKGAAALKEAGLVIPKKVVDPTSGRNYCQTAKLLAIYAHQSYGLDAKLQVVDGKKFDTRLKVIAKTYARLADQAAAQPKAGDVAVPWQAMSDATARAEERLRASGLQVQSQEMIVQLAKMATSVQDNLPAATRTLKATCGVPPEIFAP